MQSRHLSPKTAIRQPTSRAGSRLSEKPDVGAESHDVTTDISLHGVQRSAINGYFVDRRFQSRGMRPLPDALVQRSFVADT